MYTNHLPLVYKSYVFMLLWMIKPIHVIKSRVASLFLNDYYISTYFNPYLVQFSICMYQKVFLGQHFVTIRVEPITVVVPILFSYSCKCFWYLKPIPLLQRITCDLNGYGVSESRAVSLWLRCHSDCNLSHTKLIAQIALQSTPQPRANHMRFGQDHIPVQITDKNEESAQAPSTASNLY